MSPKVLDRNRQVARAASIASACFAMLLAFDSVADHSETRRISLSGFGTVGVVHSGDDRADYNGGQYRSTGAGFSDDWSLDVDSRIGAQLDVALDRKWALVVQVIGEPGVEGDFEPAVEWANISFSPTPDVIIRLGRTVLPTFMVADSRKVGYANVWVRPPPELYALAPLTSNDGIEAIVRARRGEWLFTTQATIGHAKLRVPSDITVDVERIAGINQSAERGALLLRASFLRAETRFDLLEPFFDAFRPFGPAGERIANLYGIDGKLMTVWSVGANYQALDWFAMAEYGRADTRSVFGRYSAWYVTSGYRLGEFTPYLSVARLIRDDPMSVAGLDPTNLPPAIAMVVTALNGSLNDGLGASAEQVTIGAGVRWEFSRSAAVKVQFDHIMPSDRSHGLFTNVQPDHARGTPTNVLSISLDFVF